MLTSRALGVVASALALVAVVVAVPARAHALGGPPPLSGTPTEASPAELAGMEVLDHRGAQVSRALAFKDQTGARVTLGDYLRGDVPVVMVLAYYTCPGLCTAVLNDLLTRLKALDFTAGKDFRVVVVSFDARDDVEVAAGKRQTYVEAYGRQVGARGFDFLVADAPVGVAGETGASARALAETLGFQFKWDDRQKLFGHPGALFVLSPTGTLSVSIPTMNETRDLRLGLIEAGEGKLGSFFDQAFARCFHWDPDARGYKLAAFKIFKFTGLFVLGVVSILLLLLWRAERRRRHHSGEPHVVRT